MTQGYEREHVQSFNAKHAQGAKNVQFIAANASQEPMRKLRVAGYCRVSTDQVSQQTSIESQRIHYRKMIEANPSWTLVDIYWETGVSGTRAENRPQLQRLLGDCKAGRIDLVVTKSISRFSRNTSDCLGLMRQLSQLGVTLRFEKERIQTDHMESEFLFTVLSAFAQEESRSISTNMKWGIRKRFEAGTYRPARAPYGYRKIPKSNAGGGSSMDARDIQSVQHDGVFIVDPFEADVVRGIFQSTISGKSMAEIATGLNAAGVPTWSEVNGAGHTAWTPTTIRSIVCNPFYMGDELYQKTYVDDGYCQRRNRGELDRFLNLGAHPAIVDRNTFCAANATVGNYAGRNVKNNSGIRDDAYWAKASEGLSSPMLSELRDGGRVVKIIKATGRKASGSGKVAGGGAAHTAGAGDEPEEPAKQRVCAYCRVSSNSPEQETSYEAQVVHYTNYIKSNPDWVLVGIFADEGISGTQAKSRPEFNRMIAACERGEIDLVITKSISRFARNTLDCLNYIRRLKALGIPIIFEKESINTMESAGEMLVTILASIAQQESKSISDNVRMGIEFGFQEGRGRVNYSVFLGYTGTGKPGQLAIVPEEARIVRRIFREYLEGFSPNMIANRLMRDDVAAPAGGKRWYATTVSSILGNEKYCGDLLMQKYVTEDFLTHKVVRNTGQRPQYFVEGNHDPIVPKAVFNQVQGERARRAALKDDPSRLRFGSSRALAGRLMCGVCGRALKRYSKSSGQPADWRCRQRAKVVKGAYSGDAVGHAGMGERDGEERGPNTRCACRIVPETEACEAVLLAFNELPSHVGELGALQDQLARGQAALDELIEIEGARLETLGQEVALVQEGDSAHARVQARERSERFSLQRADCANRAMQVRMLRELVDDMDSTKQDTHPFPCVCSDYDDFFQRTRYQVPRGVVDERGEMMRFNDGVVVRYLARITVEADGNGVFFKAGICIRIVAGKVVKFEVNNYVMPQ